MREETFSLEQLGTAIGPLLKRGAWADLYRQLLNASPEGFLIQEAPGGRVLYGNETARAFLEAVGFKPAGLVESSGEYRLYDAEGAPYPAHELPWVRALRDQRAASAFNLWLRPERGKPLVYAARSVPVRDSDGACLAVLTHLRDLTPEKEAEAKMREATTTDELTGAYNRRYLNVRIGEEIARSVRYSHPLACLVLDIDHFKEINDRYGHPGGDLVLQNVAHLLQTHLRTSDVVCRWGGEEFVVLLPETPLEEAVKGAERVRGVVEAASWEYGRHRLAVTISAGLAAFDPAHPSADTLLNQADQALLEAKQTRNCIRVHQSS